ncbi:DUF6223 family protein [Actinocorallia sp. B10E7]|uniref:DUF6223 family protein n=1 Tax=Actinocorallia sp. B10E7 TaxID=3153558 RepID=UPI00325C465F
MFVRFMLAVAGAALIGVCGLTAPAATHGKEISEVDRTAWSARPAEAGAKPGLEPGSPPSSEPLQEDTGRLAAPADLGTGRSWSLVAGAMGLISAVVGGRAARSAGRTGSGGGRRVAIAAGAAGLVGTVIGGLHLAYSAGGFGTGNGRAGAIVAVAVGLIGLAFNGLALARSRRTS